MSSWKIVKLVEIVDVISEKIDVQSLNPSKYISTENMLPNKCGIEISSSLPNVTKVNKFCNSDTLFSNIRTYFKKVWQAEFSGGASPDVLIFRTKDKNILDPDYLYYLLSDDNFIEYSNLTSKGAKMPRGDKSAMMLFEVNLPNLDKQQEISAYLKSVDNKIQLNTQTNQTLEQIAQAIFKSWFVDFDPVKAKVDALANGGSQADAERTAMQVISGKTDAELTQMQQTQPDAYKTLEKTTALFPSEMVESELGSVPKGWVYCKVGDVIEVVDYVANGSFASLKANVTLLDEPNYAIYVRTTDFNAGFSKSLKYVDKKSYDFLKKSSLNGNEVIISNVGDVGTVFRPPKWLNMPMTLGSNAIALKADAISHYLYFYFNSNFGQWQINGITSGSAQMKFNKTGFRNLKFLVPDKDVLTIFESRLDAIYNKITENTKENKLLSENRDLLLPKLLSGELEV